MMQLVLLCFLVCLTPQNGHTDPRDDRIKEFLKRSDIEAWEQYLWNNPQRNVTLNDIMLIYKKQYGLEVAINYRAFGNEKKHVLLDRSVKKIASRDEYIPRGLALQLYLDSLNNGDLTYHVQNGTIWIVPGKGTLSDESKNSELGETLRKTKPSYDDKLNLEATNRSRVPPTDLLKAIQFFADESQGNFRFFVRERNMPRNLMHTQIKVPAFAELSYDAILKNLLDQVNASYIIHDNAVIIVPGKNGSR